MDVGTVERIAPLARTEVGRGPADVSPALGVRGAARMLDDSYTGGGRDQHRGMEEDAAEENAEDSESRARPGEAGGVNLFA